MNLNIKYVFNITILILTLSCNSYKTKQLYNKSLINTKKPSVDNRITSTNELDDSTQNEELNQIISYSEKKLSVGNPESLLGNFICDISMFSIKKNKEIIHPPDFCVYSNEIFKTPLNKGKVTRADIHNIFPSKHELVIAKLESENLNLFLKYIVNESLVEDSIQSGVSISGIRFKINADKEIKRCMVNNSEINQNKTYYLLTTFNFLNKNVELNFLKNSYLKKTNLMLKEVVLEYLHQISLNSININAELDGRITINK